VVSCLNSLQRDSLTRPHYVLSDLHASWHEMVCCGWRDSVRSCKHSHSPLPMSIDIRETQNSLNSIAQEMKTTICYAQPAVSSALTPGIWPASVPPETLYDHRLGVLAPRSSRACSPLRCRQRISRRRWGNGFLGPLEQRACQSRRYPTPLARWTGRFTFTRPSP